MLTRVQKIQRFLKFYNHGYLDNMYDLAKDVQETSDIVLQKAQNAIFGPYHPLEGEVALAEEGGLLEEEGDLQSRVTPLAKPC